MSDPRVQELESLLPRCLLFDWVRLGSRWIRLKRDRHHPAAHEALLDRLVVRARASAALVEERRRRVPAVTVPADLPIAARHAEILAALRANQVVIVAGETGSGKTTQIPKFCLEAGLGIEAKIGCTQPRRLAALSISRRLAEELGVAWGREVGCKIRFDDRSSPETLIKLMTDGILLAEVQGDPLLSEYNALVLDEAHERSLNIDFLLGHLQGLLGRRRDLKLVVTSATLDTEAFSRAFGNAPILEVSGRMYPVEVIHQPLDAEAEERGDRTYVDAAVAAAERILDEGGAGDVLIFMPGERDIREVADQLSARAGERAEVIPLFGRLSAGEQQRVFGSGDRRRVIVATNIAETSLTIPGIRYVIDSGLVRLSRYNPRTRTRRLPIEPISQSSANQRKGRAGRVQEGVCIRLYSEDDFRERPPFTQPEIQRANLAEVILRMKAFHLGDIETFPFLDPPSPAAIQNGYDLLQELGALDARRELTALGADLARLPIDPTLGRMLLQAEREHAVRELLIIASGLSIQDPRERPLDQQAAADAAHRRQVHPESDFLTLLNLWNAVHDQWESLRTQNQRRKFCRSNFLSYTRMREWQDLHAQLSDALADLGTVHLAESNAAFEAVHRSILSGLLAHVGRREDRNLYVGAGNRRMMVFPGSAIFERVEKPSRTGGRPGAAAPDRPAARGRVRQPAWIMAGEIVETNQRYARVIAGIDPRWVVELAPHLCRVTHQNPRWSASAGRVLVEEIATLHGLELQRRPVAYGRLNPPEATAIFIRSALVEENLFPPEPGEPMDDGPGPESRQSKTQVRARLQRWAVTGSPGPGNVPRQSPYAFLEHNHRLRQRIEDWQTRVRRHDLGDLDEALRAFYARHLSNVSSRDELNRWLREHPGPGVLRATEADLTGGREVSFDAEAFPDAVTVGGQPVPIAYAYAPGEEHDGVTVRLPHTLADAVSSAFLEWAVPGLREAKAEEWLRALPKSVRAQLLPIAPKAAEIARDFQPTGSSILADLARFIERRYGVIVPASAWSSESLPPHLRARIEVLAPDRTVVAADRDLVQLRARLASVHVAPGRSTDDWAAAAQRWERFQLTGWTFGDLPGRVTVTAGPGLPVYGWVGLEREGDQVHVRLHRTEAAARAGNLAGFGRLVELALGRDLAWVRKDLRDLARLGPLYAPLGTVEQLENDAYTHLQRQWLPASLPEALTEASFRTAVESARARLPGLVPALIQRLTEILTLRQSVASRVGEPSTMGSPSPPASSTPTATKRVVKDFAQLSALGAVGGTSPARGVAGGRAGQAELANLVPAGFVASTPPEALVHLPRYLKALKIRLERAALNPVKDRERAALVDRWVAVWESLRTGTGSPERWRAIEEFRWMLEEYRVSVFAQELGTAAPVSAKRLEERLAELRAMA